MNMALGRMMHVMRLIPPRPESAARGRARLENEGPPILDMMECDGDAVIRSLENVKQKKIQPGSQGRKPIESDHELTTDEPEHVRTRR